MTKTLSKDIQDLVDSTGVTAYLDVLGWGGLTPILAKCARKPREISAEEEQRLQIYQQRLSVASQIDQAVHKIITELSEFTAKESGTWVTEPERRFIEGRHTTIVRVSDSVFVHSTSFSNLAAVVAEFIKRGLKRGVMFRAGLAFGHVKHFGYPNGPTADSRQQDISFFGDGITSAVNAEKACKGHGVMAAIHPDLLCLLEANDLKIVRPDPGLPPGFGSPAWWMDFSEVWRGSRAARLTSAWSVDDLNEVVVALLSGPDFEWNRVDDRGKVKVQNTIDVLLRVREEFRTMDADH